MPSPGNEGQAVDAATDTSYRVSLPTTLSSLTMTALRRMLSRIPDTQEIPSTQPEVIMPAIDDYQVVVYEQPTQERFTENVPT